MAITSAQVHPADQGGSLQAWGTLGNLIGTIGNIVQTRKQRKEQEAVLSANQDRFPLYSQIARKPKELKQQYKLTKLFF